MSRVTLCRRKILSSPGYFIQYKYQFHIWPTEMWYVYVNKSSITLRVCNQTWVAWTAQCQAYFFFRTWIFTSTSLYIQQAISKYVIWMCNGFNPSRWLHVMLKAGTLKSLCKHVWSGGIFNSSFGTFSIPTALPFFHNWSFCEFSLVLLAD